MREHQLGVAQNADVDRQIRIQIAIVVRHLDYGLARRNRDGHPFLAEAARDPQDHVGFVHTVRYSVCPRTTSGADRERMVLGKRTLAEQRRHHRSPGQLREFHQLRDGVSVEHSLSHVDQGTFCFEKRLTAAVIAGRSPADLTRGGVL